MLTISPSDRDLRNFGVTFFAVLTAIALLTFLRHHAAWPWWLAGGALFLLAGFTARPLLRPLYIGWMTFAFVLGWINTRVILGVIFALVFTPVSLILRLIGKDPLNRKFEPAATSYWIRRPPQEFTRERYQQLF